MISPCVKLSDFGVLGLNNDVAVITDCQYGGRTMYMVRYQSDDNIANKLNSLPDFTNCRGVRRNFEKGFPLHLSDCYIRVIILSDCSIT